MKKAIRKIVEELYSLNSEQAQLLLDNPQILSNFKFRLGVESISPFSEELRDSFLHETNI